MTKDELRYLKVGAKVRWVSPGETAEGVVVERLPGNYHRIRWDDGYTEILNWRNSHDRARAKNIVLAATEGGWMSGKKGDSDGGK